MSVTRLIGHGAFTPATGGATYLDSVLASTCCDLDATIAASYGGSGQTWSNLIASPADGATQTDYDFWLGAGSGSASNDPTFTGSAGDPAAYFSLDGGDYFTIKNVSSPVTIYNLHKKTGGTNSWWMAAAYNSGLDTASVVAGRGWLGSAYGAYMYRAASATWIQVDRAGGFDQVSAAVNQAANTDYLWIMSVNMESTSNNVRFWVNTRTKAQASKTWTSESTNTTYSFRLGATVDDNPPGTEVVTQFMPTSKYYHFSCGNAFIDDSDAANIFDHLNSRHGRTYA